MRLTQAAIIDDFSLSFFTEEAISTRLTIAVVDSTLGIGTRFNAWLRFLSKLSLVGRPQALRYCCGLPLTLLFPLEGVQIHLIVYPSKEPSILEAGKVWLYYATSTHQQNYIEWNSGHCLYSSYIFPNKSFVLTPLSLRGRCLKRLFKRWVPEDDERQEVTIRSTREWIVPFTEPELPALSYHWETEASQSSSPWSWSSVGIETMLEKFFFN
ncbi:hypothetical protein V8E54_002051 [Elaphomyces granulatus]